MAKYTIIIEKGEGNYSAYCPDLPGVVSAAETEEETAELMKEAIEFHLEGLKEDRIPIPEPTISANALMSLYKRPIDRKITVIIPVSGDLKIGLLKSAIRKTGLDDEEFLKLLG
jgi:predicted RNase H-like HicB family nuclease